MAENNKQVEVAEEEKKMKFRDFIAELQGNSTLFNSFSFSYYIANIFEQVARCRVILGRTFWRCWTVMTWPTLSKFPFCGEMLLLTTNSGRRFTTEMYEI